MKQAEVITGFFNVNVRRLHFGGYTHQKNYREREWQKASEQIYFTGWELSWPLRNLIAEMKKGVKSIVGGTIFFPPRQSENLMGKKGRAALE